MITCLKLTPEKLHFVIYTALGHLHLFTLQTDACVNIKY